MDSIMSAHRKTITSRKTQFAAAAGIAIVAVLGGFGTATASADVEEISADGTVSSPGSAAVRSSGNSGTNQVRASAIGDLLAQGTVAPATKFVSSTTTCAGAEASGRGAPPLARQTLNYTSVDFLNCED